MGLSNYDLENFVCALLTCCESESIGFLSSEYGMFYEIYVPKIFQCEIAIVGGARLTSPSPCAHHCFIPMQAPSNKIHAYLFADLRNKTCCFILPVTKINER